MIFGLALYWQMWGLAIGILLWWMFSRSIKALPYLRRKPQNFWIVPVYVLSNFVSGLIKIYALATLNTQGWMTRGHTTSAAPGVARRFANGLRGILVATSMITALFLGAFAYLTTL